MGMAAACDIAIGAENCAFGLTEVRFGIVWSPIAHAMDAAIGTRETRRYALSGERFGAAEGLRIGLLHEVVAAEALDSRVAALVDTLLANGPEAMAAAKSLVLDLAGLRMSDETLAEIAQEAAYMRAQPEAKEGLSAFLEKRVPAWATR
jgi:methylglutaconyl-CoA hydratase